MLGKLAKQSAIYGMGAVFSKAIGFLLIPIYTHYLTPADYGVLELLELTTYVISIFLFLGVNAAVIKHYYHFDDKPSRNQVVSTAALFMLLASLSCLVALQFNTKLLSDIVFGGPGYAQYYQLVLLAFFFSTLVEVPLAYIRARNKALLYLIITLSQMVVGLGLNIFFIVVLHRGVWGILYSKCVVSGISGILLMLLTLRDTGIHWSWPKLKMMVRFGLPLVPSSIGMFILVFSDRFFLKHFTNLDEVGIYSLAYKFGMGMAVVLNTPFGLVWQPQMFDIAKREGAKQIFAKLATVFSVVSMSVGLVVVALSDIAIRMGSPPAYWPAAVIIPFIVGAYIFDGLKSFTVVGMLLTGETKYIGWSTMAAALLALALNVLLIPRWHALGAGIATVIAYASMSLMQLFYSQKLYWLKLPLARTAELLVLWGAVAAVMVTTHFDALYLTLIFRTVLVAGFALISWHSGMFTQEERLLAWQRVAAARALWRGRPSAEAAE